MLPTIRRWLHRMVCPHKTWLPCPEIPGQQSQIECPCCGKLQTIEHAYNHADTPSTSLWLHEDEEYAAYVEKVRRGEISINALRAEQNLSPSPEPRLHEDK